MMLPGRRARIRQPTTREAENTTHRRASPACQLRSPLAADRASPAPLPSSPRISSPQATQIERMRTDPASPSGELPSRSETSAPSTVGPSRDRYEDHTESASDRDTRQGGVVGEANLARSIGSPAAVYPTPLVRAGSAAEWQTADNGGQERSLDVRRTRRSLGLQPPDLEWSRWVKWSSSLPTRLPRALRALAREAVGGHEGAMQCGNL